MDRKHGNWSELMDTCIYIYIYYYGRRTGYRCSMIIEAMHEDSSEGNRGACCSNCDSLNTLTRVMVLLLDDWSWSHTGPGLC